MSDDEKQISTVVKLGEKTHRKCKVDAAKTDKTVSEVYADIINEYYKGKR